MNIRLRTIQLAALLAGFFLIAAAQAQGNEEGKPGHDFREAAAKYEQLAGKVVRQAAATTGPNVGRYLQLGVVYRQMADIKANAAALADEGRWQDIRWHDYEQLEQQRNRLLATLAGPADPGAEKPAYGKGFRQAALEYEEQAASASRRAENSKGAARTLYGELAGIFRQMAEIKYQAARAQDQGKKFDWSRYEQLSARRDQLSAELEPAR